MVHGPEISHVPCTMYTTWLLIKECDKRINACLLEYTHVAFLGHTRQWKNPTIRVFMLYTFNLYYHSLKWMSRRYDSKVNSVGQLDGKKLAASVLLCVFIIGFPASPFMMIQAILWQFITIYDNWGGVTLGRLCTNKVTQLDFHWIDQLGHSVSKLWCLWVVCAIAENPHIANIEIHLDAFGFLLFQWFSEFSIFSFFWWQVTRDTRHITCDMWHVTCDIWHVKCDTWHRTCDASHMTFFCNSFLSVSVCFCIGIGLLLYFFVTWKKPCWFMFQDCRLTKAPY